MERLTEKQSAGYDLKEMNGNYCDDYCKTQSLTTCNDCGIYEAIQRLAEYEDTGLAPDEIHKLNDFEQSQMATLLKEKAILLKEHFELKKERNYWRNEALKWASELGEQKLERGK